MGGGLTLGEEIAWNPALSLACQSNTNYLAIVIITAILIVLVTVIIMVIPIVIIIILIIGRFY